MLQQMLYAKMATLQMNNRQFAEHLGITKVDLSRLLHGKRSPSLNIVKAIYAKYPDLADVLLKE